MNEITNALRVVNVAFRTIRIMDIVKRVIGFSAVAMCCLFAFNFWKNK